MLHFQPFVRIYVVRKMENHDFDILLTRLKDRMYRFAYTLLRQSADAEDAVQDVVERLWRYRRRIDPDRNADSLFMTSVRNACLDRLRQKTSNPIDRRELAALLDDISYIKTISTKQLDSTFIADALAVAAQQDYQIISAVEENGRKTSFYIAEYYAYSDFLMLSFGQGEWIVMGIRGRFDVSNISRLTNIKPRM